MRSHRPHCDRLTGATGSAGVRRTLTSNESPVGSSRSSGQPNRTVSRWATGEPTSASSALTWAGVRGGVMSSQRNGTVVKDDQRPKGSDSLTPYR